MGTLKAMSPAHVAPQVLERDQMVQCLPSEDLEHTRWIFTDSGLKSLNPAMILTNPQRLLARREGSPQLEWTTYELYSHMVDDGWEVVRVSSAKARAAHTLTDYVPGTGAHKCVYYISSLSRWYLLALIRAGGPIPHLQSDRFYRELLGMPVGARGALAQSLNIESDEGMAGAVTRSESEGEHAGLSVIDDADAESDQPSSCPGPETGPIAPSSTSESDSDSSASSLAASTVPVPAGRRRETRPGAVRRATAATTASEHEVDRTLPRNRVWNQTCGEDALY